jgi:hypothetical protein
VGIGLGVLEASSLEEHPAKITVNPAKPTRIEKNLSICKNARGLVEQFWQNRENILDINAGKAGNDKLLKAFFDISILKPIAPFLAF